MKRFLTLALLTMLPFSVLLAGGGGDKDADVKFIYAEGKIFYQEIFVTWSTEFEAHTFDYLVEASKDKKDWRIRGKVRAKGKGQKLSEYKFVDKTDANYKYYRIRKSSAPRPTEGVLSVFELDDYSIEVTMDELDFMDSKRLVMEYSIDKDQELMIRIYNRIGEQVVTKRMPFKLAGDYIYHLDISDLKPDNYLLVVTQVLLDKTVAEKPFKVNR